MCKDCWFTLMGNDIFPSYVIPMLHPQKSRHLIAKTTKKSHRIVLDGRIVANVQLRSYEALSEMSSFAPFQHLS